MPFKFITKTSIDANVANFTLTNIPQTYSHLLFIYGSRNSQDNSDGEVIAGGRDPFVFNFNLGVYSNGASAGGYIQTNAWSSDNGAIVPAGHRSSFRIMVPRYSDSGNIKIQFGWGAIPAVSNNNALINGANGSYDPDTTPISAYFFGPAQTNFLKAYVWIYGISNA